MKLVSELCDDAEVQPGTIACHQTPKTLLLTNLQFACFSLCAVNFSSFTNNFAFVSEIKSKKRSSQFVHFLIHTFLYFQHVLVLFCFCLLWNLLFLIYIFISCWHLVPVFSLQTVRARNTVNRSLTNLGNVSLWAGRIIHSSSCPVWVESSFDHKYSEWQRGGKEGQQVRSSSLMC